MDQEYYNAMYRLFHECMDKLNYKPLKFKLAQEGGTIDCVGMAPVPFPASLPQTFSDIGWTW